MPALWPLLLLGSQMTGAQIVLAADPVPQFDVRPSCRSAAVAAVTGTRDSHACEQDESDARGTLEKQWSQFSAGERGRCVALSGLGGSPSYVELLTCLEMAAAAKKLPPADKLSGAADKD
jgi:hypothetical protein